MAVDTPIVDRDVRGLITDVRNVDDRVKRGESFRRYLDSQHRRLCELPFAFDWPTCNQVLSEEMKRISERKPYRSADNEME
jgi:hypothetical protein